MPGPALNWRAPLYRLYEERVRGRKTFRYLDFLLDMQWRPEEEVRAFQWSELQRLLRHAYDRVPFHRRRFRALGVAPDDIRTPEDYRRLPIMTKRDFAECQEELLADNADRSRLYVNGSGGSTGEPMRYLHDHDSYEWRQAAHTRGNMWAGSGTGVRELHLWGEPMKRASRVQRLKKRAWHFALNHHYCNSYSMSPETMAAYLDDLARFRPEVIVGYSYSLYLFARFAAQSRKQVWAPRGIIGTAEKLLPHQRAMVEETFGAKMYDRYGCREVMLIGMECEEQRGLHLAAENLYVELLHDGRPAAPGETGEVVVTDLHNYAMPFLRYRNGDVAVASDRRCPCGRGLPLMEEVRGRTLDVLCTPDGRRISGVFVPMFFKDYDWIEEFQVVQPAIDRVEVKIKPTTSYRSELLPALERDLQRKLGPSIRLEFSMVEKIDRAASGKHRPIVSKLKPEELENVALTA